MLVALYNKAMSAQLGNVLRGSNAIHWRLFLLRKQIRTLVSAATLTEVR